MRTSLIQVRHERRKGLFSQHANLKIKHVAGKGTLIAGRDDRRRGSGGSYFTDPLCKFAGSIWKDRTGSIWEYPWKKVAWLRSIGEELPCAVRLCAVLHSKRCHSGKLKYDWHIFECSSTQHLQLHTLALNGANVGVHTGTYSFWSDIFLPEDS